MASSFDTLMGSVFSALVLAGIIGLSFYGALSPIIVGAGLILFIVIWYLMRGSDIEPMKASKSNVSRSPSGTSPRDSSEIGRQALNDANSAPSRSEEDEKSLNSPDSSSKNSNLNDQEEVEGMVGSESNPEIQLVSQLESEVGQKLELDHHIEQIDKEVSEALQDAAKRLKREQEVIEILENSSNPTEAANRLGQAGVTHSQLEQFKSDFNEIETDLAHVRRAMEKEKKEMEQEEELEQEEEVETEKLNEQVNKLENLFQRLEKMQNTSW